MRVLANVGFCMLVLQPCSLLQFYLDMLKLSILLVLCQALKTNNYDSNLMLCAWCFGGMNFCQLLKRILLFLWYLKFPPSSLGWMCHMVLLTSLTYHLFAAVIMSRDDSFFFFHLLFFCCFKMVILEIQLCYVTVISNIIIYVSHHYNDASGY